MGLPPYREGLILINIYNGKKVRHKSPEETKQAVQGIGLNKKRSMLRSVMRLKLVLWNGLSECSFRPPWVGGGKAGSDPHSIGP